MKKHRIIIAFWDNNKFLTTREVEIPQIKDEEYDGVRVEGKNIEFYVITR